MTPENFQANSSNFWQRFGEALIIIALEALKATATIGLIAYLFMQL